MSERWVEHQAVYLAGRDGRNVQPGLYFYRSDQTGMPFCSEECSISRLGKHIFPSLDEFNQALLYACRWAIPDKEIVEPPPMPPRGNGKVVVWTRNCSRRPCVFGVNKEDAKEIIFSLASTRSSLVK
jgi:hypothetical protein